MSTKMRFTRPGIKDFSAISDGLDLGIQPADLEIYAHVLEGMIAGYERLSDADDIEDLTPSRTWEEPVPESNVLNAWFVRTSIKERDSGPLHGKRIAIKDSAMIAGLPMMNGSSTLSGYKARIDATVVKRILDAGGEIVGKSNCEFFCCSGGSHTGAQGAVRNPYDPIRSAGGSSSGSAALVAFGDVDMAIGTDQGGSVRMPSSYCGTYGMKPTYGLVPCTGVMPIEVTIDHVGPITSTVANNALMLSIMAGPDGYDARQDGTGSKDYASDLGKNVEGMRVGLLAEGFEMEGADPVVNSAVADAVDSLTDLGIEVKRISLVEHTAAMQVFLPLAIDGLCATMMYGDGFGVSRKDRYPTDLMAYHRQWRERAHELAPTVKTFLMMGTYARDKYGPYFYAKAMNEARKLKALYDGLLGDLDAIIMPTTPMQASVLPDKNAPLGEILLRAFEPLSNTAPFNITGHPAFAVPCGMRNGLPVSMMLVGAHHQETKLYRLAHAFEQNFDWKTL